MNERMKELRKAMGKSQEEFGKILGITKSGVSDIESGRRNVTEQHIIMLRNENVNEEWLRTGNGEMFIPETKDEQITNMLADVLKSEDSDFKKRLIVALSKMDDTGWGALEKFIDSIAEQKKNKEKPRVVRKPLAFYYSNNLFHEYKYCSEPLLAFAIFDKFNYSASVVIFIVFSSTQLNHPFIFRKPSVAINQL